MSTITRDFCEWHMYDVSPMKQMLCLEGTGGLSIPYLGYIEATIRIPPIKDCWGMCSHDGPKFSSPFCSKVPVKLGTVVLDQTIAKITVEPTHASNTWWQTYMSTMVVAGAAGAAEQGYHKTPIIDAPMVTAKSIVIPPLVV